MAINADDTHKNIARFYDHTIKTLDAKSKDLSAELYSFANQEAEDVLEIQEAFTKDLVKKDERENKQEAENTDTIFDTLAERSQKINALHQELNAAKKALEDLNRKNESAFFFMRPSAKALKSAQNKVIVKAKELCSSIQDYHSTLQKHPHCPNTEKQKWQGQRVMVEIRSLGSIDDAINPFLPLGGKAELRHNINNLAVFREAIKLQNLNGKPMRVAISLPDNLYEPWSNKSDFDKANPNWREQLQAANAKAKEKYWRDMAADPNGNNKLKQQAKLTTQKLEAQAKKLKEFKTAELEKTKAFLIEKYGKQALEDPFAKRKMDELERQFRSFQEKLETYSTVTPQALTQVLNKDNRAVTLFEEVIVDTDLLEQDVNRWVKVTGKMTLEGTKNYFLLKQGYEGVFENVKGNILLQHQFLKIEIDKILEKHEKSSEKEAMALEDLVNELLWARNKLLDKQGKEDTLKPEEAQELAKTALDAIIAYQLKLSEFQAEVVTSAVKSAEESCASALETGTLQKLETLQSSMDAHYETIQELRKKYGKDIQTALNDDEDLEQQYLAMDKSYEEISHEFEKYKKRIQEIQDIKEAPERIRLMKELKKEIEGPEEFEGVVQEISISHETFIRDLNALALKKQSQELKTKLLLVLNTEDSFRDPRSSVKIPLSDLDRDRRLELQRGLTVCDVLLQELDGIPKSDPDGVAKRRTLWEKYHQQLLFFGNKADEHYQSVLKQVEKAHKQAEKALPKAQKAQKQAELRSEPAKQEPSEGTKPTVAATAPTFQKPPPLAVLEKPPPLATDFTNLDRVVADREQAQARKRAALKAKESELAAKEMKQSAERSAEKAGDHSAPQVTFSTQAKAATGTQALSEQEKELQKQENLLNHIRNLSLNSDTLGKLLAEGATLKVSKDLSESRNPFITAIRTGDKNTVEVLFEKAKELNIDPNMNPASYIPLSTKLNNRNFAKIPATMEYAIEVFKEVDSMRKPGFNLTLAEQTKLYDTRDMVRKVYASLNNEQKKQTIDYLQKHQPALNLDEHLPPVEPDKSKGLLASLKKKK